MDDQRKSKAQLIAELQELRERIATLTDTSPQDQQHRTDKKGRPVEGATDDFFDRSCLDLIDILPAGILLETAGRNILYMNFEFCRLFHIPHQSPKAADSHKESMTIAHILDHENELLSWMNDTGKKGEAVYVRLSDTYHESQRMYGCRYAFYSETVSTSVAGTYSA